MTTEIALPPSLEDQMKDVGSQSYTPYVNILDARSPKVNGPGSEQYEGFANKLVLAKDKKLTLLGDKVDVKVLSVRMRAFYWTEGAVENAYMSVQSGEDPETYERIRKLCDAFTRGAKIGGEYLIYLPDQDEIATLFCGGSADRKRGGTQAYDLLKKGIDDITFFREWYNPKGCKHARWCISARQATDAIENEPDPEKKAFELNRFQNPVQFSADSNEDDGR